MRGNLLPKHYICANYVLPSLLIHLLLNCVHFLKLRLGWLVGPPPPFQTVHTGFAMNMQLQAQRGGLTGN